MPDDAVINFEDLAAGTVVDFQYLSIGVSFQPSTWFDSGLPYIETLAPGQTTSGSNVLVIRNCSGEFCASAVVAKFSYTRSRVQLFVGDLRTSSADTGVHLFAYDAGGAVLTSSSATVTSGTGIHTPLEVNWPAGGIDSIEIRADGFASRLAIDDLRFDTQDVRPGPDFGITITGPIGNGVRQGASVSADIRINRVNASHGRIYFSLGSPSTPGVSYTFKPYPASGDSAVMTINADYAALLGTMSVTVVATPGDASSGPVSHSVTLFITVWANYGVLPIDINVPPCTEVAGDIEVYTPGILESPEPGLVPKTFDGGVDLSITAADGSLLSLPGITIEIRPSSVSLLGVLSASATLFVQADLGAIYDDITVTLVAKNPLYSAATATVRLHAIAGQIFDFTPNIGETPHSLRLGTEVELKGTGFCPPDVNPMQVQFGNPYAIGMVTRTAVWSRVAYVNVPRLATNGILIVTDRAGTFSSSASFKPQSYRNTHGFSFTNGGYAISDITLDDMNDAFGKDQTYYTFTFDPCSDATLGLLSCPLFSFSLFPKLETMIMLGIEKSALTGSSSGHCYGMSLGSERFQRREARYIDFAPYSAHSGWQLSGPAGASPELDHYLRILSVSQLCTELISYWLRAAGKIWASSSDFAGEVPDIRAAIAEDLIAGNYPLLALRQGGTGHVVVATDLEDGDAPGVAFYVYIYDPNVPFLASEQTNADEHKLREAVYSRITVYQDGRWMYQKADGAQWGPGYFHSRDYSLVVIPYHAIPLRPSLPGLLDIPRFVLDVVFGDAEITQIAHADGRYLYHPDGTPNGDAGTRLPDVAPFAPFLGAAGQVGAIAAPQMYFLGYPGAYTQIVRNGGGAYTASVMSSGFSATAERGVVATPSVDALTFHAGAGSFGMQSSGPGKPVKITLACTAEDGSARTAMVETVASGGAGIQVAFDQGRDAFEYRHDGENATLNVTLGWAGPGGLPRTFAAPALLVVPGEMAILRPVHWPALHSAGVELAIYHRNGSVERRNLPPAEPRPAPVVITELEVEEDEDDSRNARRLEIHLRRTSQDSDLVALVAWVVLRNRQVVARHTITLSGGQLSPGDHQRSWRFIPPAPGPYEFVGTVTTLVRAIPADSYLDRQSTGFVVL